MLDPLSNATSDDLACMSYFPEFSPVNEEKSGLGIETKDFWTFLRSRVFPLHKMSSSYNPLNIILSE